MGKRRWCGGLVFEEVGVSYLGRHPLLKKAVGRVRFSKKEGVRCTTNKGVACQACCSFQECLIKSVAPRVWL